MMTTTTLHTVTVPQSANECDRWLGTGSRHPATRVPSNYIGLHGVNLEVIRCATMSALYEKHKGVYGTAAAVTLDRVHECAFDLESERKSLLEGFMSGDS